MHSSESKVQRDRGVDALRALAIGGAVLGHWLVTAVVAGDTGLATESPLRHHTWMIALTWLLQTLAPFFLAAGYAGAISHEGAGGYLTWLRARLGGLAVGAGLLAAFWIPLSAVLFFSGTSVAPLTTVLRLVVSPLWFLLVYAVLVAAVPLLRGLDRRFGLFVLVVPVLVVALDDLMRAGVVPVPAAVGTLAGGLAVVAGWMIPFQLGLVLARGGLTGRLSGRGAGLGLLLGGIAATVALVVAVGYPASMVGIPGQWSNLNPVSLAAVTFGLAQAGGFLLLRPWLSRVLQRPALWRPVAAANRAAVGVYFWHQSSLLLVTLASAYTFGAAGLVDSPADPSWLPYRVLWLPAFALVLVMLCVAVGNVRLARRPATLEDAGDRSTSPPAAAATGPARPSPTRRVRRDHERPARPDAPEIVVGQRRGRAARPVQRDALQPGGR